MSVVLSVVITAFALALDAFAVSVAAGLSRGGAVAGEAPARWLDASKLALCFGGFQSGLAALGVVLGSAISPFLEGFAPLVAGLVLVGLGIYGIRAALSDDDELDGLDFFSLPVLASLGLATSIDAFAAGVSFGFAGIAITAHLVAIGVVCTGLCLLGVRLADALERVLGSKAELGGGVALLALGAYAIVDALVVLV